MSSVEKYAFAARMNQVADLLGIPPKGRNRQYLLGKAFGVSQESARKWLEGESFPSTDKCIEIAKRANIYFEWLMTGRGPMKEGSLPLSGSPEEQVLKAMQTMDAPTKYRLTQITEALASPAPTEEAPTQEPAADLAEPATTTPKRMHFGIPNAKRKRRPEETPADDKAHEDSK